MNSEEVILDFPETSPIRAIDSVYMASQNTINNKINGLAYSGRIQWVAKYADSVRPQGNRLAFWPAGSEVVRISNLVSSGWYVWIGFRSWGFDNRGLHDF